MSIDLLGAKLRSLVSDIARLVGLRSGAAPLDPVERLQRDGAGESVTIEFSRLSW
jgi:hypothetical protein